MSSPSAQDPHSEATGTAPPTDTQNLIAENGEAANTAPAHNTHEPVSENGGKAADVTSTHRKLWTAESPFFDDLTMSAIVLDRLQQHIRFEDGPLYCLHAKDQVPELNAYDDIDKKEVQSKFLDKYKQTDSDVTVFFLSHIFEHLAPHGIDPRKEGIMRFTLSLNESVFVWLFQAMGVHPSFIESLNYMVGQHAVFTSYSEDGKSPEILHILVKVTPASHLEGAFYIQHNFNTKKDIVIVAGNDLSGHLEMLAEHFQRTKPPYEPFAIALVIIMRYLRFIEAQRIEVDHAVIMTERETGRGAVAYSTGEAPKAVSPENFDLTFMHWIEGNQRNVVYAAHFQLKLAAFLITEHLRFVRQRDRSSIESDNFIGADRRILDRLKSHESMVKGLHDLCLVVRERIQRQLSAADSIINQSDNKVSIRNAETSTNIAEQSRRIPDESKAIAAETRRDSTSMKTIASLTMIYLPSTFAASFFSTGFFSYDLGTESMKVNREIWKMLVVALGLSFATIAVWIYLNKKGTPRIFNWAKVLPVQQTTESSATTAVLGSGALGLSNKSMQKKTSDPETGMSLPRINIPVPIDGDMA